MNIKSRDTFKWAKHVDTGKITEVSESTETRSYTQKTPVLCAFPVSNREGFYNVWRFDTPGTMRIAFGLQADSEADAISKAMKKGRKMCDKERRATIETNWTCKRCCAI